MSSAAPELYNSKAGFDLSDYPSGKMNAYALGITLFLVFLAHRAAIVFYRLYLHPLAKYPGPKLAAASTLYRAYYQFWRDGKLVHKTIQLHEIYGPVVRVSPNELDFSNPAAYHDIYSTTFNGMKDPDFYDHLRGEAETFFTMGDPADHKARFRPIASLFSNRYYDRYEINIKENVEKFSSLLSLTVQLGQPCHLALGYRSLFLAIVNDFIFTDIPDGLRSMASVEFDDPLTLATGDVINWTMWFTRNFPTLSNVVNLLPRSLVSSVTKSFEATNEMLEIMAVMVQHEKDQTTPKHMDCVMQRLLNCLLENELKVAVPPSDALLRSEAIGIMLAGSVDPPNILAFGTFMVTQNSQLQQRLYEELKSMWPDSHGAIPSYQALRQLPILNGVVKESIRLTYGVAPGPPRLVGTGGARIDGRNIPAKTVVAVPSYFVHMDTTVFPNPEKFEPERWDNSDHSNSLVAFSRGRRMCPAEHFSYIEIFVAFATVFRRFHVAPYKTTVKDFEWNSYFSNVFTGRPLEAILRERAN